MHTLLLEALRARARARTPARVLEQYRRDPFVQPAACDQRRSLALDLALLSAAPQFDAIELSPVAPLATCSAVALTDQHRVLSALRATEVVADPTNVLALECARRLASDPTRRPVHLATVHRTLRAQPHPKQPGFAPHFRLFALASGGVETAAHGFTVDALAQHVRTLVAAVERAAALGYTLAPSRITLASTEPRRAVAERVAERLDGALAVTLERLEHGYYNGGLRYSLWVKSRDGIELPLGDGGVFDWLATLGSNRRAVFVASGLGAQLISTCFAPPPER